VTCGLLINTGIGDLEWRYGHYILPNLVAWVGRGNYVKVVEDRPILSATKM